MTKFLIGEDSLRTHFITVPNLIDDMELDPITMRVYIHLKRVAGEGGDCYQSISTIASHCKISKASVCRAKKLLLELNLITVLQGDYRVGKSDTINIVDVWKQNRERYTYTTTEGGVPYHRGGGVSVENHKKNPIKKNRDISPPNPSTKKIKDAFVEACGYPVNWRAGNGEAAKWLADNGYTPEQVVACYKHLKSQEFWDKKTLGLASITKQIGEFVKSHPSQEDDGIDYNKFGYNAKGELVEIK